VKTLSIEGVRAFRQPIGVPLGKLTLLVGENSTGKSTILACARIAWDVAVRGATDFNEPPFELGSYPSIAHYHGGQGKRVSDFSIGAAFSLPIPARSSKQRDLPGLATPPSDGVLTSRGTFKSDNGSPRLTEWTISDGVVSLAVLRSGGDVEVGVVGLGDKFTYRTAVPEQFPIHFAVRVAAQYLGSKKELERAVYSSLAQLDHFPDDRPYAIAPVRSRPRRTYDPIRDQPNPEGVHIPALLSRLHGQSDPMWTSLSTL
jgi:hypothetical protein